MGEVKALDFPTMLVTVDLGEVADDFPLREVEPVATREAWREWSHKSGPRVRLRVGRSDIVPLFLLGWFVIGLAWAMVRSWIEILRWWL